MEYLQPAAWSSFIGGEKPLQVTYSSQSPSIDQCSFHHQYALHRSASHAHMEEMHGYYLRSVSNPLDVDL